MRSSARLIAVVASAFVAVIAVLPEDTELPRLNLKARADYGTRVEKKQLEARTVKRTDKEEAEMVGQDVFTRLSDAINECGVTVQVASTMVQWDQSAVDHFHVGEGPGVIATMRVGVNGRIVQSDAVQRSEAQGGQPNRCVFNAVTDLRGRHAPSTGQEVELMASYDLSVDKDADGLYRW